MENYGFVGGLLSRLSRKFIPEIPDEDTFEFYIKAQLEQGNSTIVIKTLNELLADPIINTSITEDLNNAISALSSKVISFGFDHKFQAIFKKLNIDSSCYKELLFQINSLTLEGTISIPEFYKSLDDICNTVLNLRKNKNIIGTSMHLTVVTKNLLNYVERIKILLDLKSNLNSDNKWKNLIDDHISYDNSKNSLSKFFDSHVDLLALEIVEHTAQKGDAYVANTTKEYNVFFKKGLLGGLIIAVFALFKILLDAYVSATMPQAFMYSINYALCFIIVYFLGGTIATKQPAMTASTIAKNIDKDGDLHYDTLQDIILLLRKISRSQFISLLGNFIMAFSVSYLIAFLLASLFNINPISTKKSIYLINQVFPFSGGAIYFAAIAGVFLSISGFISGYFDNKVKASNLAYRIQHNKFLSRHIATEKLKKSALLIEKSLGVYAGNISLGFFLGSAFLLSYVTPFNIDIRHIAFSSANVGYGIINHAFSLSTIAFALGSVLIIGLINFFVSFSLTFLLVLKSRGLKISKLGQLIKLSVKDIITNPLAYVIIRDKPKSN